MIINVLLFSEFALLNEKHLIYLMKLLYMLINIIVLTIRR